MLIGFGNARSVAVGSAMPAEWWPGLAAGLTLVAGALAWARFPPQLSAAEIGLVRRNAVRSAALGSLLAVGAALVALVVLRFPPMLDAPVRYVPIAEAAPGALLLRAFVLTPLDTAIPEELAYRGVLLGRLRRTAEIAHAVLLSAAAFTLSHAVIVLATIGQTNVRADLALLGAIGAYAAVFAGGVIFAVLRIWTGHLAAPIAAHATFNAAVLVGLSFGG